MTTELHDYRMMDVLRVSRATAYRLLKEGALPGRKIGGSWRVPVEDFKRYLENDARQSVKS
jgi:excisionase family DNA binding protein